MNTKLKALGLVLIATLALSLIGAPNALADEVHSTSGSGTTFLTGSQIGVNQLDTPGGNIKCNTFASNSSYSGTTATTITILILKLEACTAFGLTSHVDMMGCHFHIVGISNIIVLITIICPTTAGGVTDEITITTTQGGVPLCTIDVPEQSLNGTISNNVTDISLTPESNAVIDYTVTYASGEGTKCGTKGKHTNEGRYTGSITAQGFSDAAHTTAANLSYT